MSKTVAMNKAPEFVRKDSKLQRVLASPWFWLLFIVYGFSFPIFKSLNRTLPPELPVIGVVPEFHLQNENGQTFGSNDLKGRVYLSSFFFSRCPSVCPKQMKELESIQNRMKGLGSKAAIVSFTVDPEYDKSAKLFEVARLHHANPYVWTFLTGENKEELLKLFKEGFKVPVAPDTTNLMNFAHSEKIVLVDTIGRIRGYYNFDQNDINKLMIDVGLLINRPVTKE